jgi:hypothetical protein
MVLNPKYGTLGMFMLPTSLIWVGIIIYSIAYLFWNTIISAIPAIKAVMLVGFDWQLIWKTLLGFRLLQLNYLTGFGIMFLAIALLVVKLSVEISGEKLDLKNKKEFYALYFVTYNFLISFFWLAALAYIAVRGRKASAWRGNRI